MRLSERLVQENQQYWRRWRPHPFTREVAEGTLDEKVFLRWLAQDYLFVREGLRFLAVLLGKAPAHLLAALADTIHAWKNELELFRAHAERAGAELQVRPFFVTRAYLDFLLAVAHQTPFQTGWAVLFAVERSYHDAWRWAGEHAAPDNPYREWIDNWGSAEFGAFVAFLADTLDEQTAGLKAPALAEVREKFAETARFEALFWDMAYHGERFDPLT